jgi:hypothetical protein
VATRVTVPVAAPEAAGDGSFGAAIVLTLDGSDVANSALRAQLPHGI